MRRRRWMVGAACAAAVGLLSMASCAEKTPEPTVLVIGDSLTVGAEIGGLGGDGRSEVDAEVGRTTDAGVTVAEDADVEAYEQVIVALGTNDYGNSAAEFTPKIDAMMAALGPDVPVTWVNVDTGTPKLAPAASGVNAALAAAAGRYENLTIADWDAYINGLADPDELRAGDEVHDSPEGYRARAEWMADLMGS